MVSRQTSQRIAFSFVTLGAILVILPIFLITAFIAVQGIRAISWEFITGFPADGMKAGGIFPAIVGTILLTIGTAIVAMPIGIGAAIYLADYATFFLQGELVEHAPGKELFTNPQDQRTEDYITGRFG